MGDTGQITGARTAHPGRSCVAVFRNAAADATLISQQRRGFRPRGLNAEPGGLPMATAEIAGVPLTDIEHRSQLRRAVIASTVGTTIEWYDFLLYGQMAAIVFAK
jgi:hypothetical protein